MTHINPSIQSLLDVFAKELQAQLSQGHSGITTVSPSDDGEAGAVRFRLVVLWSELRPVQPHSSGSFSGDLGDVIRPGAKSRRRLLR